MKRAGKTEEGGRRRRRPKLRWRDNVKRNLDRAEVNIREWERQKIAMDGAASSKVRNKLSDVASPRKGRGGGVLYIIPFILHRDRYDMEVASSLVLSIVGLSLCLCHSFIHASHRHPFRGHVSAGAGYADPLTLAINGLTATTGFSRYSGCRCTKVLLRCCILSTSIKALTYIHRHKCLHMMNDRHSPQKHCQEN